MRRAERADDGTDETEWGGVTSMAPPQMVNKVLRLPPGPRPVTMRKGNKIKGSTTTLPATPRNAGTGPEHIPNSSPFKKNETMSKEARRRLPQVESNTKNQLGLFECTFTLNVKKIKSAYRKAALKYHPDKATGDRDKFTKLGQAVEQILASARMLRLLYPELETNLLA